jgi:hypothetical protein
MSGTQPRGGVALIIAISVLAALLFLALPFVFSQSASVAGARAAAWDGTARRGSDRATGLATALSAYANGLHRSPQLAGQLATAQLAYVQLPAQIATNLGYPSFVDNSWRTVLESGADWSDSLGVIAAKLDGRDALHGAIIEDESRRIDPNNLGERAWAVVLERAGIRDPYTIYWTWSPGPAGLSLASYGSWGMADYGRLARALSWWRPANSRRFNRIEDLLGADPDERVSSTGRTLGCIPFGSKGGDPATGMANWPVPEAVVEATRNGAESDSTEVKKADPSQVGYRVAPLTQAELERLRPLLSFLVPGQGRSGIVDLGTVVAEEPTGSGWYGVVTDELDPSSLGVGAGMRSSGSWARMWRGGASRTLSNGWLDTGDALALDVPPALNINTVPADSRITALYHPYNPNALPPSWPKDPWLTPTTSVGGLGRLRWLDPRTGDGTTGFERPPLGITGFGIVAVEGSATALDPQAHSQAQRRRRTVVQAVEQERPVEVAWRTQGELEALVRLRHGSWIQAGPRPTSRVADWGAQSGDMALLDLAGWIEPAPFCSYGRNPAVAFDWRVPFGLTGAKPWADVLSETGSNTKPDAAPGLTDLQGAAGRPGLLTAQGLRLEPGVSFSFLSDDKRGPLLFAKAARNRNPEILARHVALRFCFPSAPGSPATLLEMRAQDAGHDASTPPDGTADDRSDGQSIWRVDYRPAMSNPTGPPTPPMLVLVIANSALPWTAADRTRHGMDAWTMATDVPSDPFDARCNPDAALPFAPPDPAQRVEFRYVVAGGLEAGRWYHLQAWCASDRPGLHGLILDGVVGRDATRAGVDLSRTGDHYTFPCLRLDSQVAMTVPASTGASALSDPRSVVVSFPQHLLLADLLPPRGLVRIDDEYFSYTGLSDGSAGSGTLTGVQRARRINTQQDATEDDNGNGILDSAEDLDKDGKLDPGEDANGNGFLDSAEDLDKDGKLDTTEDFRRWPVTQQHERGALVTPGWSQASIGSGRWLRGQVALVGPAEKPEDALTPRPPLAKVPPKGFTPNPDGSITWSRPAGVTIEPIDWGDGKLWTWGDRGYVEFWIVTPTFAGRTGRCYFTRSGTALTLDWTKPLNNGGVWGDLPSDIEVRAVQVSIEVAGELRDVSATRKRFADEDINANGVLDVGEDTDGSGGMWTGGPIQVQDPMTGRCEWIRTTDRLDLAADGKFFLMRGGGFNRDPLATPSPLGDVRGAMRTPWRQDASWPNGSVLLPVQTDFGNTDRFESGDVVTLVPETVSATDRPVQLVVRHAARDGYPQTTVDSGSKWDTINEWFAFTGRVPDALPDPRDAAFRTQHALIGRGWNGDDLSLVGNTPARRGSLPRQDLLATGATGPVRIFLGCPDPLSLANPTGVVIDDLCAGPMAGPSDANSAARGITNTTDPGGCEVIAIGGSASGTIGLGPNELPLTIQVSEDLFATTDGQTNYGLAQIDGEVFAWRRVDNRNAVLIARGLLGTCAVEHRLAGAAPLVPGGGQNFPNRPVRPTLPIAILPLGPVAELCSPLAAGAGAGAALDVIEIPFTDYFRDPESYNNSYQRTFAGPPGNIEHGDPRTIMRSPVVLLHDPAGTSDGTSRVEALRLLDRPASDQRITATWLRGLYGTGDQAWTAPYSPPATRPATWVNQIPPRPAFPVQVHPQAQGALNPIVIGWWPRFAPGMPATVPAEALRSRSFAWAGFPLRLAGARFDPAVPVLLDTAGGIADVQIATDAGLRIEARALAAGTGTQELFDWDAAPPTSLASGPNPSLVGPFAWARFTMREVDGAELRVLWQTASGGTTQLLGLAGAQGRTPRLGTDDTAAANVPTSTAAAVRLRCVAPTRVLAVEEVR